MDQSRTPDSIKTSKAFSTTKHNNPNFSAHCQSSVTRCVSIKLFSNVSCKRFVFCKCFGGFNLTLFFNRASQILAGQLIRLMGLQFSTFARSSFSSNSFLFQFPSTTRGFVFQLEKQKAYYSRNPLC